jgi:hypothetical protein
MNTNGLLPIRSEIMNGRHLLRTLIGLVLVGAIPDPAFAQLDETWTVAVGGQTAQVNPDGTFRIANISAQDRFGAAGPGSPSDQISDDYVRVTGSGLINGVLHWVASEPFRIVQDETYAISSLMIFTIPPPDIAELAIDVENAILEPGQQTQATTTAVFNDGTTNDVTSQAMRTSYRTSNPSIATVDEEGVVTATGVGNAFITVLNTGTTATRQIRVLRDTVLTTVEGFVEFEDGTPVDGANVLLPSGGESAITDADGFFSIDASVSATTTNLGVFVDVVVGNETWNGEVHGLASFADGVTDAGIIKVLPPPCEAEWVDGHFCPPGVYGQDNATPWHVESITRWGDGSGDALYVGGEFTVAGCTNVSNLARWDGSTWSRVGDLNVGRVFAQTVFDDGAGADLYVGGDLFFVDPDSGNDTFSLARWDGADWSRVGGFTLQVRDLAVFDDGTGPALYVAAGTIFPDVGSPIQRLAKWDGTSWTALGAGFDNSTLYVETLTVFDDGSGPALYAGGTFTSVAGITANRIARWDGTAWSAVGDGPVGGNVNTLAVFDDGGGPALYAGGFLQMDSGFGGIAKWDGTTWAPLDVGGEVHSLAEYDDGSGAALFAGGSFNNVGGETIRYLTRWHPDEGFSPLGTDPDSAVTTLNVLDDGGGPELYIGGWFSEAGDVAASRIARWNGSEMASISPGSGMISAVNDAVLYDDGSGPALYATGFFTTAGNTPANKIAKWDGSEWSPLGEGIPVSYGQSLAVHDDGNGSQLYVSGPFHEVGGVAVERIARWNGSTWSAVGDGVSFQLLDMMTFDDGTGPALYTVGTGVYIPPPVNTSRYVVERWDGSEWTTLPGLMHGRLWALAEYDDGRGPALYVGGEFSMIDDEPVNRVARWCGSGWESLANGIDDGVGNIKVTAMTVHDDGTGPALYVGGHFTGAGGIAASKIARWDGSAWTPLGSGVSSIVYALTVFDDGTGKALYAAGNFGTAGGSPAAGIARWDGATWTALEDGLTEGFGGGGAHVSALLPFDDGTGPALFVGGAFSAADGLPSTFMAKWQRPQRPCPAP